MKQKSEGRRDLTDLSILNGATDIGAANLHPAIL